jgi:hypothetical protein
MAAKAAVQENENDLDEYDQIDHMKDDRLPVTVRAKRTLLTGFTDSATLFAVINCSLKCDRLLGTHTKEANDPDSFCVCSLRSPSEIPSSTCVKN